MKNIYLLPTEKPSRLFKFANELHLDNTPKDYYKKYNIYITSANEEIKEGDWCIVGNGVSKLNTQFTSKEEINTNWKKIILTTDQDLIKNGVQKIDDEFLEWFVKNPSCEFVDVYNDKSVGYEYDHYSIIIPQEEPKQDLEKEMFELEQELDIPSSMRWHNSKPKQETLEEVGKFAERKYLERLNNYEKCDFKYGVIEGAKWQAERIPSIIEHYLETAFISKEQGYINPKKWFEQFKKK